MAIAKKYPLFHRVLHELIALHFIAAMKHRFFAKKANNVLPRMM